MRSGFTAARIRDAAIDMFGRRGFEAASVREIAREAAVSPALVIHHYGSKDKLREHCDDYLMREGLRTRPTSTSTTRPRPQKVASDSSLSACVRTRSRRPRR
ncbi:MAG: helix-turn-helix domain-containing protein [Tessaracoccus sp.]